MSRYRLRPKADQDLVEIWRYTAQRWNVGQADSYFLDIVTAIEGLLPDA